MASVSTILQERRQFPRSPRASRLRVDLIHPTRMPNVENVNLGAGGLCLRLQEALDVRSLVRLHMTPSVSRAHRLKRSLECTGRVAWVSQRLDLRSAPPFLFDVGIELIQPSPLLRRLMTPAGAPAVDNRALARAPHAPDPAAFHGRHYVPCLERDGQGPQPWHLVVHVDGAACFSGRYASRAQALGGWTKFKREQSKR